jgi:CheY-like chemotaxis protein
MLENIMLVDDSHNDAMLLSRSLRRAGLEERVVHIHDPRKAVAYLKGDGEYADRNKYPLPEILLLDLKMPEMDGFQLLRWARSQSHLARLVIVVVTRTDDPRLIQMCYQLGANSFLSKDANVEELRNFVQFFTHYSRVSGCLPDLPKRESEAA